MQAGLPLVAGARRRARSRRARRPLRPQQGCRRTAPAVAPRHPRSPGRPIRRLPRTRPGGRLLVDTDVAADDLVALTFLVASPQVRSSESRSPERARPTAPGGVDVVLRLLDRLNAPEIPVACGRETPLAGAHAFPSAWREHVDGGSGLVLDADGAQPIDQAPPSSSSTQLATEHASPDRPDARATHESRRRAARRPRPGDAARARLRHGRRAPRPGQPGLLRRPRGQLGRRVERVRRSARGERRRRQRHHAVVRARWTGRTRSRSPRSSRRRAWSPATARRAAVVVELFAANPFMTDGSFYLWDPLAAQLAAGYPIGSFSPACDRRRGGRGARVRLHPPDRARRRTSST